MRRSRAFMTMLVLTRLATELRSGGLAPSTRGASGRLRRATPQRRKEPRFAIASDHLVRPSRQEAVYEPNDVHSVGNGDARSDARNHWPDDARSDDRKTQSPSDAQAAHGKGERIPRVLLVNGTAKGSAAVDPIVTELRETLHEVEVVTGAFECLSKMQPPPDLVFLADLELGMSWTDLCRQISRTSDVPIVIGTCLDSEIDAVLAFELGVTAYVSDTGRTREAVARIRAALRPNVQTATTSKPNGSEDPDRDRRQYHAGPVKIDLTGRDVTVGGSSVYLARREFDLLAALLRPAGRVHTREELIDHVWKGRSHEGSRTLDTHIRKLRLKLEYDPGQPRHLVTVRGVGFRFDIGANVSVV